MGVDSAELGEIVDSDDHIQTVRSKESFEPVHILGLFGVGIVSVHEIFKSIEVDAPWQRCVAILLSIDLSHELVPRVVVHSKRASMLIGKDPIRSNVMVLAVKIPLELKTLLHVPVVTKEIPKNLSIEFRPQIEFQPVLKMGIDLLINGGLFVKGMYQSRLVCHHGHTLVLQSPPGLG